jgi:hypothetical protein
MQMFGQTGASGTVTPNLTNIGDRWTKYCQALVLTSILGNPPSVPQTLTAVNAGVAPNSQNSWNITSKLREAPFELVLLPYAAGGSAGTPIPFSTT